MKSEVRIRSQKSESEIRIRIRSQKPKITLKKEGENLITTYHAGIKRTYLKNNLFNNKVYFGIVDDSSGCGCGGGGSGGGSSSGLGGG